MSEYKIGYVMKVTKKDDFYFGRIGKIEDRSSNPRQFCLRFAPGNMTAWFYAHELIHLQPDEIPFPERTELAPAQPATADAGAVAERLENYRAIFHDVIAGHLTSTPEVQAERGLYLLKHIADLQAKLAAAEARADAAVEALVVLEGERNRKGGVNG